MTSTRAIPCAAWAFEEAARGPAWRRQKQHANIKAGVARRCCENILVYLLLGIEAKRAATFYLERYPRVLLCGRNNGHCQLFSPWYGAISKEEACGHARLRDAAFPSRTTPPAPPTFTQEHQRVPPWNAWRAAVIGRAGRRV